MATTLFLFRAYRSKTTPTSQFFRLARSQFSSPRPSPDLPDVQRRILEPGRKSGDTSTFRLRPFPFSVHASKFRIPQVLLLRVFFPFWNSSASLPFRSSRQPKTNQEQLPCFPKSQIATAVTPLESVLTETGGCQSAFLTTFCSAHPARNHARFLRVLTSTGCWPPICFFWSPTGTQKETVQLCFARARFHILAKEFGFQLNSQKA